jgi:hypothetical protein
MKKRDAKIAALRILSEMTLKAARCEAYDEAVLIEMQEIAVSLEKRANVLRNTITKR